MYFVCNMALNPNFTFSSFNTFSCDSDEQSLSQKGARKWKKKQKTKYRDKTLTKTEKNRLWMEIYQQERCSKKQEQKISEYDRKRAAETRL